MRRTATVIAFFALNSPLDFAAAQIPENQEIKFFLDSFANLDKKAF